MPLKKARWGETIGMGTDRFGISEMVNVAESQEWSGMAFKARRWDAALHRGPQLGLSHRSGHNPDRGIVCWTIPSIRGGFAVASTLSDPALPAALRFDRPLQVSISTVTYPCRQSPA